MTKKQSEQFSRLKYILARKMRRNARQSDNNCFSKFSNRELLPIFISTILQSVRKAENF